MPFLGNTPANTFVSIAKQTITGNGGTSYSLSYAVTSANDIDVFYNNVRQEPGVAYTANSTTITFTEAIQSTDSVYILFNGQAVGTIDAPAGAYLPTTGGTVNGQLSVNNKIQMLQDAGSNNRFILRGQTASSYRWNIDNFGSSNNFRIFRENDSDATSGMVVAQFDSGGRLTLPTQPSFFAISNSGSTVASGNVLIFGATDHNVGSCYSTSTGRFTAPISGRYMFYFTTLSQNTNSWYEVYPRKNGTLIIRNQRYTYGTANDQEITCTILVNLTANDYVDLYQQSGTSAMNQTTYNYFGGHLVG